MIAHVLPHDPSLERYRSRRDDASLRVLMQEHVASVRAVIRRVLSRNDLVDDATQEVFVRLARDAGTIQGTAGPWLRTVALRIALDHLRTEASHRRCDRIYAEEAMRAAQDSGLDREVRLTIGDCISRLPEQHRHLLARRFFLGMTQDDIAAEDAVSQVAVHKRLRSALSALRWQLLRSGIGECIGAMSGGSRRQMGQHAVLLPDPALLSMLAIAYLPTLLGNAARAGACAGLAAAALSTEDILAA